MVFKGIGFLLVFLVLIVTDRQRDPGKISRWLKNQIESENSCRRDRSVANRNVTATSVNTTELLKKGESKAGAQNKDQRLLRWMQRKSSNTKG